MPINDGSKLFDQFRKEDEQIAMLEAQLLAKQKSREARGTLLKLKTAEQRVEQRKEQAQAAKSNQGQTKQPPVSKILPKEINQSAQQPTPSPTGALADLITAGGPQGPGTQPAAVAGGTRNIGGREIPNQIRTTQTTTAPRDFGVSTVPFTTRQTQTRPNVLSQFEAEQLSIKEKELEELIQHNRFTRFGETMRLFGSEGTELALKVLGGNEISATDLKAPRTLGERQTIEIEKTGAAERKRIQALTDGLRQEQLLRMTASMLDGTFGPDKFGFLQMTGGFDISRVPGASGGLAGIRDTLEKDLKSGFYTGIELRDKAGKKIDLLTAALPGNLPLIFTGEEKSGAFITDNTSDAEIYDLSNRFAAMGRVIVKSKDGRLDDVDEKLFFGTYLRAIGRDETSTKKSRDAAIQQMKDWGYFGDVSFAEKQERFLLRFFRLVGGAGRAIGSAAQMQAPSADVMNQILGFEQPFFQDPFESKVSGPFQDQAARAKHAVMMNVLNTDNEEFYLNSVGGTVRRGELGEAGRDEGVDRQIEEALKRSTQYQRIIQSLR